jgi:hypothetical protein
MSNKTMTREFEKMTRKQLITVEQAAEITSMSIAWWRQALAGKKPMPPIRVIRIGKAVRLHLGDLLSWIESGGEMINPSSPRLGRRNKRCE